MSDYNINGLAIPLFLVFMLLEFAWLRVRGKQLHRYNDSVASLSMGLCLLVSDALLKAYTFAVFIWLWQNYRIADFSSSEPITWLVFFLGVDFCYYWFHRAAHSINVLWGAHVGHHQSEEYNLTTALRQSAFQYAFSWVFYLPLAILGCPPEVFLLQFVFLKLYQFWLHTQGIGTIPFIEGIFSTPSSHRVHHAKNPIYIDKNYGGTLVVWDRFFGSWQPELATERCHYGTTRPLDTLNPIRANLQHWQMLAQDCLQTRSAFDKFRLWFKATGWRPEDCSTQLEREAGMQKSGSQEREKYDPQTTRAKKVYAGVSMALIIVFAAMFLFLSPSLSAWQLGLGAVLIVGGLVVVNDLLENKTRYAWVELLRVPVLLWMMANFWATTSTTEIVDRITINASASTSLDYASAVKRWPEWHPQSLHIYLDHKKPLLKGEVFEEDILTPIGQNHMRWQVQAREPGKLWIAHAHNQTNGSLVELEYRVKTLANGHTEFERTLVYTLPNFALVAANALHFKKVFERKSEDALVRLKLAVEGFASSQN